ncbi:MAG: inositol 2-dehydrogenase, partial [Okeania sp. SIO3B3]|nr:inositol 2-dehydrogenase [Okeania sp. SIO3B3]
EVFGSAGNIAVSNNTPHRAVLSDADGVHGALPLHFFLERYMDAYVAEMEAFIQAIAHDGPVPATGLDGRIPVVMGLAAWQSHRENRPVKLSEIA